MKYTLSCLLICFCFVFGQAQTDPAFELVKQGVDRHDAGAYDEAIALYKKALKVNPKSALACYEIAFSYFTQENYKLAYKYSKKVIKLNDAHLNAAYRLNGSSLDLMGKQAKAISVYEKGILLFPKDNMLYYNEALSTYKLSQLDKTAEALMKSIELDPAHASSHLLLGYVKGEQGERVKSVLPLYFFLMLETQTERSEDAYQALMKQIRGSVTKEGAENNSMTITLDDSGDEDASFLAAELMLSMLEISRRTDTDKTKTEAELFSEQTKSFFTTLAEIRSEEDEGLYWDFYVDFYGALTKAGHSEVFSYMVSLPSGESTVQQWLEFNGDKFEAFLDFIAEYE